MHSPSAGHYGRYGHRSVGQVVLWWSLVGSLRVSRAAWAKRKGVEERGSCDRQLHIKGPFQGEARLISAADSVSGVWGTEGGGARDAIG